MANTIKIKRGNTENLGTLLEGEIAFSINDKNLMIGTDNGNYIFGNGGGTSINNEIATDSEVNDILISFGM